MVSAANPLIVDVVIVVNNCALAVAQTLERIPRKGIRSIVVVDNGSTDNTGQVARDQGAVLLRETKGGYGSGCRRALRHLEALPVAPEVVVFIDPLSLEDPAEINSLLLPFRKDRAELVIATLDSRRPKQVFVDKALIHLISALYGHQFGALSSFRAVRFSALIALGLSAKEEGWNVEMLVKAVRLGLNIVEVPIARLKNPGFTTKPKRGVATGQKLLRILRHAAAR